MTTDDKATPDVAARTSLQLASPAGLRSDGSFRSLVPTGAAKSTGLAMGGSAVAGLGAICIAGGFVTSLGAQMSMGVGIFVLGSYIVMRSFDRKLLADNEFQRVLWGFNIGGLLTNTALICLMTLSVLKASYWYCPPAVIWLCLCSIFFVFGGIGGTVPGLAWHHLAQRRGAVTTLGCGKHSAP